MTVTIAERSTHAARRQAVLSRVSSVDAAAQSLVQTLQDEATSVDPEQYPLVVTAARTLLSLVSGIGSGELHLLVDPAGGTAVRIRHDGSAAVAEVVRVGPAREEPAADVRDAALPEPAPVRGRPAGGPGPAAGRGRRWPAAAPSTRSRRTGCAPWSRLRDRNGLASPDQR